MRNQSTISSYRGFLVLAWLVLSAVAGAQTGPVAWVESSLRRVGKTDAAGSLTSARIWAARGEYESFQVVVKAPQGGLSNVNFSVSDLQGPNGQVIPKTSLTLYREHYVYVNQSSPNWGGSNKPLGAGWYPDALIPFNDPITGAPLSGAALDAVPFTLAAANNQPIWVDVLVPRGAAAGDYIGTYTITSNQGSASGQIWLTVWNFTLPLKPSLKSSFLFWHSGGLESGKEILRNRLTAHSNAPADQRTLIDQFGLSTTGLGFWSGASVGNCTMSAAPSVAQFQASASTQQPDLSLYDYSADEIGSCTNLYPIIQQWARNMHQAGVKNLVTMAPTPALYDDGSGSGKSAVDIWVMLPLMYDRAAAQVADVLRKGDAAWSYNTLVQDAYSPKWLIDFAPINFRIQPGMINQSLGLSGLLYWQVDRWAATDPWNNINNAGQFSSSNYPGEGILVYPGAQVGIQGVAPSMRLKWLRDGADDYEYIAILKGLGRGDWALQQARSVGADWTNWTRDTALLESVRQQLGDEIDRLSGGGGSAPSAPVNPTPANGATGVAVTQALSWSASSGATSYDVYLGTTASPGLAGTTTTPAYAPGTLAAGTTYYWRVVAKNSAGSTSSATWRFATAAAPGPTAPPAPVNPVPANGASGIPVTQALSWSACSGATSYDVYLGTSAAPGLVGTVTAAAYTPASLAAGTTYYWRVVAKNSAGSTSSATWSFATAASGPPLSGPTPVSVNPSSGAGSAQTFSFLYGHPSGYAYLDGGGAIINTSPTGSRACWIYYQRTANTLFLAADNGSSWSSRPLGSSAVLQNKQCSVGAATVSVSGNYLTLKVSLTFKSAFAGSKTVYMYAVDTAGKSSGYKPMGTWTVR